MAKIEIGRWSDQLRRMFGMAGVTEVSGELSPEVSPVVVLEQPGVDLDFFKQLRWCWGTNIRASAAGFTDKFRLRNPANSGVIAVIRLIETTNNGTRDVVIAINNQTVDFSTSVSTTVPDTRWGPINTINDNTALVMSAANDQVTGPAGDQLALVETLADTPWRYTQPIPVLPGVTVDWGTSTLNSTMRTWVCWTERALPALER